MRGFTLLELMVVITIVVVVTALILVRQTQFNSSTLLRSLAYSVALSMRQAQVYGTTIFGIATAPGSCVGGTYSGGNCFAAAYGVFFSGGDRVRYSLFGDLNNSGKYDSGDGIIQTFELGTGYQLSRFCAGRSSNGSQECWLSDGSGSVSELSIVFKRTNPDACFATNTNPSTCSSGGTELYSSSSVQITSGTGDTRTVIVTTTGQIAVCPVNRAC